MKTEIFCIICEFFTAAGILCAFIMGAQPDEILAGVLVMLLASLVLVRQKSKGTQNRTAEEEK